MMSFVYAQDQDGGIGYDGKLPWDLPNDMKFFVEQTMGHTMVMGRKTFESMDKRLLPGRETVVVTSQKDYGKDIEGLIVVNTIEEVLELGKDRDLKVIGGAGLFESLFDHVDEVIRTVIFETFPTDVHMPEVSEERWKLVKVREGVVDEENKYEHRFEWWERK